jgi:transposase
VTDIHGVGPLGAAIILGRTSDIGRFPTSDHYARYTGTAPIAASSGPNQRHRLNPRGNRQLDRALHVAAVTQVRNDTPGRAYYRRDRCSYLLNILPLGAGSNLQQLAPKGLTTILPGLFSPPSGPVLNIPAQRVR